MKRKFWFSLTLTALFLALVLPQLVYGQMGTPGGMMQHPGMGGADTQMIHQLFAQHEQIRRTVEKIPDGIRATTESDNPEVATLIQTHVAKMYDRLQQKQPIPMIGMSATLPRLSQSPQQYQRQVQKTAKGIIVTETATDPKLVALIQKHAQEVSGFVKFGMSAMMDR